MTRFVGYLLQCLHSGTIDRRQFKPAALIAVAVLTPALHANAQFMGPKVADAKPGEVRVIATAAIREPLNARHRRQDSRFQCGTARDAARSWGI